MTSWSVARNAATKCVLIIKNIERVLAIELLTAVQALHFRRPLKTSPVLEKVVKDYSKDVPFIDQDRLLHDDIEKTIAFISKIEVPVES